MREGLLVGGWESHWRLSRPPDMDFPVWSCRVTANLPQKKAEQNGTGTRQNAAKDNRIVPLGPLNVAIMQHTNKSMAIASGRTAKRDSAGDQALMTNADRTDDGAAVTFKHRGIQSN